MKDYKFTGYKLMTKGITKKLPKAIINFLWLLIETIKSNENLSMDYLQVFEIKALNKDGEKILSITHIQEVPPYMEVHLLKSDVEIEGRIYVIDDIERVTMLWAHEY